MGTYGRAPVAAHRDHSYRGGAAGAKARGPLARHSADGARDGDQLRRLTPTVIPRSGATRDLGRCAPIPPRATQFRPAMDQIPRFARDDSRARADTADTSERHPIP